MIPLPNLPRWARGAILLAVALAAFLIWLGLHDRAVIERHDNKRAAEVSKRTLQAERTANSNEQVRRVERDKQAKDLETAINEAVRENPDETSRPVGPAVRAALRELREAAARNSPPAR